ncbi:MAG: ornithine cyclodeaminase family protein [Planctomycetota bacterium]|nr:ornithine cyclodeaminase family protein [Planctomycetota bacterium]
MPYLIKKRVIEQVLKMSDVVRIMEQVFRLHGLGKTQQPPKMYLMFEHGDMRSMPAYITSPTMDIAGIKCVTVHPDNPRKGLPTVMATILLIDPKTGYNIAVLDGTLITDMRTGAAGALAAKYLSRKSSRVVGFVGGGRQAQTQLAGLMVTRPIKEIKVYDIDKRRAEAFCRWARSNFNLQTKIFRTVCETTLNSDIVVTTTPSRKPLVRVEDISPGTHINAIGADAPGKQELESQLTKRARIVIDEWEQASHSGEINVPLSEGVISKKDVYAELGKIVAGVKKGRTNDKAITIFDSTGLAIQDILTAFVVYQRLKRNKNIKLVDLKLF